MRHVVGLPEEVVGALMADALAEAPQEHLALVHFAQRQGRHLRSSCLLSY